jgi:hypothetical protein
LKKKTRRKVRRREGGEERRGGETDKGSIGTISQMKGALLPLGEEAKQRKEVKQKNKKRKRLTLGLPTAWWLCGQERKK